MKRIFLFVLLTIVLGLFGCAHTIGRVEQRWGPPAKVEQQGDYTLYYYSFNKVGRRGSGVLNVTLTCDNAGNILSKSQTWEPSQSAVPLPSPYMKKKVETVQPIHEQAEVSADPPETNKEVGTIQSLHEEVQVPADAPDMNKEVETVQPPPEEAEVSADPPETDLDVALNVGVEGPPEGVGVYYDGPFDIDGISLYFYGGGFYYIAPGYPHRLLFHHRCPSGRLEFHRNHWRGGWRGFHDRWAQSHRQPSRNDPKREIHHGAPLNKANITPPKTYTSSKTNTPPSKTYTPSKANTPPLKTYTPPQKAYTPPVKTYTPPQKAYTPPPRQASVPIRYTPPPKHWNPRTKRWE